MEQRQVQFQTERVWTTEQYLSIDAGFAGAALSTVEKCHRIIDT
jgi:hypothetical protein